MLTINVVGDVMLGDQFCCFGFGVHSRYRGKYHLLLPKEVLKPLQDADLLIGNFECAINNNPKPTMETHVLCTTDEGVAWLKKTGFSAFTLANNHTLERGETGLQEITHLFQSLALPYFGTADTPVWKTTLHGKTIGMYGFTAIVDYKNTTALELYHPEKTLEKVKQYTQEVDYLLVFPHWGNEFIHSPSSEQTNLGRKLIDAGAKAVLGAHQHVLQPIEKYRDGIICYGLGNFIFDSFWDLTYPTGCFRISIAEDGKIEASILPMMAQSNYSLRLANKAEASAIHQLVHQTIAEQSLEPYNQKVIQIRGTYRAESMKHILKSVFKFKDTLGFFTWGLGRLIFAIKNRKKEKEDPSSVYQWN